MSDLDRRTLFGIAGASLAVAACGKSGSEGSRHDTNENDACIRTFDPQWNYGDAPWKQNPNEGSTFNPEYLCVVHIEVRPDLSIKAQRVHRVAVKTPTNDWASNKASVIDIINKINGGQPLLASDIVYPGLRGFSFGQPHHLAFYVKNANSSFDPDYPIWFGEKLKMPFEGSKKASKNESFYSSDTPALAEIRSGSKSVAYVQNHYKVGKGISHKPIKSPLMYSLNLNLNTISADDPTFMIPITIDPDTGNMGSTP
jgi:hypothetical protein